MRFASMQGFNTGDHFFHYLRDAFDVLYEEGAETPKMLSIGMHCRILGRPGASRRCSVFSTMCSSTIASGSAAASTSHATGRRPIPRRLNPHEKTPMASKLTLARLNAATAAEFTAALDGVYEHSPWIAEEAAAKRPFATLAQLKYALVTVLRDAGRDAQVALVRGTPRARGQGDGAQDADRRIHQRARQGRPDRLHADRVRAHPEAERGLQREVRLPVHARRARAARRRAASPRDHQDLRAAPRPTTPSSSSPSACATSTASPRSG